MGENFPMDKSFSNTSGLKDDSSTLKKQGFWLPITQISAYMWPHNFWTFVDSNTNTKNEEEENIKEGENPQVMQSMAKTEWTWKPRNKENVNPKKIPEKKRRKKFYSCFPILEMLS